MRNRHGIACLSVLVVFGLLAASKISLAQPQAKVHRIGLLSAVTPSSTWRAQAHYQAALEGLRQLGYVEGQNLVLEFRSADGQLGRLPALAAELVGLKMDVIHVGTCGAPLDATRRASSKIPIVVAACTGDMVAAGAAASLARPGGNVTGLQKLNPELAAKRLALLKEALPRASRVAVLWDPGYSDFAADWLAMRATAQALGVTLLSVEARGPTEFERAFSTMIDGRADALITFADATTYVHARRIADLTGRSRLPAIYAYREITDVAG